MENTIIKIKRLINHGVQIVDMEQLQNKQRRKQQIDALIPIPTIINRRGSFFIVSHPHGGGMNFHDTIKKSNETWKDAEHTSS